MGSTRMSKKWLKLAESSSSAPASAREASQQRIPSWPSLPALQAMRRTTDSAKRNSSPQRKGWKRDASEVVPVFGRPTPMRWNRRVGREDGTPLLSPPTAAIDALAPRPQRGDVGFIHRTSPRRHSIHAGRYV